MDDAADLGKFEVKEAMRRRVRRWPERTLDDATVIERDHDELVRVDRVARDATRLDDQDAGRPIDAGDVAERERDEARASDRPVRDGDLGTQAGEAHASARGIQTRIPPAPRFDQA